MNRFILFCCCFIFFSSLASAEIHLYDDLSSHYNFNDELSFSFDVLETLPVTDYVTVLLTCDNSSRVVFKQFVSFVHTSQRNFSVSSIADLEGSCYYDVSFYESEERSGSFVVSSDLETDFYFNSKVFLPGETVYVNGSVEKYQDSSFNYTIDAALGSFVKRAVTFSDSSFRFNLSIPADLASGSYVLRIGVEEKDLFGTVINSDLLLTNITVLSSPSSLELSLVESFKPPYTLNASVLLLDQAGSFIPNESIILRIFSPENDLYYDSIVLSGDSISIPFESSALIGGWRMSAFYASLSAIHPFYISENKQVEVFVANASSSLQITNVGNIPYEGLVEVFLENASGSYSYPLTVTIPVGEIHDELLPYSGDFNISSGNQTFRNIFITGNVVGTGGSIDMVVIWIIIGFLGGLLMFYLLSRYKNRALSQSSSGSSNSPSPQQSSSKPLPKPSSPSLRPSTYKVKEENPVTQLFRRGKAEQDINIDAYTSSSYPSSNVRDIPVIKNALNSGSSSKRVYSIFFRNDSEDLIILLKQYGLNIYKVGDMRFSLLKSSKAPEKLLLNLAHVIVTQTTNKDVLIHSVPFSQSSMLSSFFGSIRSVLREGSGILVSHDVFKALSDRKPFVHFKDLRSKENIIKLYRYVPKG